VKFDPSNVSDWDQHQRERARQELKARRAKLNPQVRPEANGSPALAALRRTQRTASGAERERIARLIEHVESLYKPPTVPAGKRAARRAKDTGKRVSDAAREAWARNGVIARRTYHGKPCPDCGGTLRRMNVGGGDYCVTCRTKPKAAA
jgi:hypothetical protein